MRWTDGTAEALQFAYASAGGRPSVDLILVVPVVLVEELKMMVIKAEDGLQVDTADGSRARGCGGLI